MTTGFQPWQPSDWEEALGAQAQDLYSPERQFDQFKSFIRPAWQFQAPLAGMGDRLRQRYMLGVPQESFRDYLGQITPSAGGFTYPQTTEDLRGRAREVTSIMDMTPIQLAEQYAPGVYGSADPLEQQKTQDFLKAAWYRNVYGDPNTGAAEQKSLARLLALQRPEGGAYTGRMADAITNMLGQSSLAREASGKPQSTFLNWYLGKSDRVPTGDEDQDQYIPTSQPSTFTRGAAPTTMTQGMMEPGEANYPTLPPPPTAVSPLLTDPRFLTPPTEATPGGMEPGEFPGVSIPPVSPTVPPAVTPHFANQIATDPRFLTPPTEATPGGMEPGELPDERLLNYIPGRDSYTASTLPSTLGADPIPMPLGTPPSTSPTFTRPFTLGADIQRSVPIRMTAGRMEPGEAGDLDLLDQPLFPGGPWSMEPGEATPEDLFGTGDIIRFGSWLRDSRLDAVIRTEAARRGLNVAQYLSRPDLWNQSTQSLYSQYQNKGTNSFKNYGYEFV